MCNPSTLNYSAQIKDELEAPNILRLAFLKRVQLHQPLVSRLKFGKQGGPTAMWLGQVGAIVSGMMRVVVNQSHFLEKKSTVNCQCGTIIVVLIPKNKLFNILSPAFFPL